MESAVNPFDWRQDLRRVFFYALLGAAVLFSAYELYLSQGSKLVNLLFYDKYDYQMDFFNVLHIASDRHLYFTQQGSYPPLAYLFFYLLQHLIPAATVHAGGMSIRASQAGMMVYSLFVTITSIIVFLQLYELKAGARAERMLFAGLFFLSLPFLFEVDRGNVIVVALILLLCFFLFKDSKSKALREIALICLAASAAFKIYPAVFGFLLLKEKRYFAAVRVCIYGLLLFFLPFLYYGGIPAAAAMFHNLFTASSFMSTFGFGYKVNLVNTFTFLAALLNQPASDIFLGVTQVLAFVVLGVGIFLSHFLDTAWKRVAMLTALMLAVPPFSYQYSLIFMFVPIVLFLNERKRNTLSDYLYLILFVLMVAPLAIGPPNFIHTLSTTYPLSLDDLLESFSLAVMLGLLMAEGASSALRKHRETLARRIWPPTAKGVDR